MCFSIDWPVSLGRSCSDDLFRLAELFPLINRGPRMHPPDLGSVDALPTQADGAGTYASIVKMAYLLPLPVGSSLGPVKRSGGCKKQLFVSVWPLNPPLRLLSALHYHRWWSSWSSVSTTYGIRPTRRNATDSIECLLKNRRIWVISSDAFGGFLMTRSGPVKFLDI